MGRGWYEGVSRQGVGVCRYGSYTMRECVRWREWGDIVITEGVRVGTQG